MNESASAWVKDVGEVDFQREVIDASFERPVVVDFWAPWCGPCRALGPVLERLVAERNGAVLLAKVNTDESPRLAEYFGISAIPAVKFIHRGQLVHEFEGVMPEASLRELLDALAPGGGPGAREEQAQALEAKRPAEAERAYRQKLKDDPDDREARVGLARVLLAQGKVDEIEELLAPVGSEGELGAEAERIAAQVYLRRAAEGLPDESPLRERASADPRDARARLELGLVLARRGDYPGALEALLAAAERDPQLAAGRVREAMVKVFYALGTGHALSNQYRAKLAGLLY
jgi:putative thioredoxin